MHVKWEWGPETGIKIYLVSWGTATGKHYYILMDPNYLHNLLIQNFLIHSSFSFLEFSLLHQFSHSFLYLPGNCSTLLNMYEKKTTKHICWSEKKSDIWISSCIRNTWLLLHFYVTILCPDIKWKEGCENSLLACSQGKM